MYGASDHTDVRSPSQRLISISDNIFALGVPYANPGCAGIVSARHAAARIVQAAIAIGDEKPAKANLSPRLFTRPT